MAEQQSLTHETPYQARTTRMGRALRSCGRWTQQVARTFGDWARFNHFGVTPPRLLRYALVGVALFIVCVAYGVVTASARANFGPHDALYEVTTDSAITADAGPLGSIVIDSPLPGPLGVYATIGEIPDSLTTVETTSTLQALGQDLDGYMQFFAAPQETISLVTKLLIEDAVRRALLAALTFGVLCVVGLVVTGRTRRRELNYRAARATWPLTAVFVIAGIIATFVFNTVAERRAQEAAGRTSLVLNGTALEGARMTGRLAAVIDEYGGKLVDVYDANQEFYEDANTSLRAAFVANRKSEIQARENADRYGQRPARASADQDLVTMVLVSDLHCNVGMAPLINTTLRQSRASILLNAGDTTMNGTDIERFCVEAFSKAVPNGVTVVQSDGNHDSALTSEQSRKAGVLVLDGNVIEVDGIRFLGDKDPRETRAGQGSVLKDSENYADAGARLAKVSCEAEDAPDILLIHTPAVGSAALSGGCMDYQFSGHTHTRTGPVPVGRGIQYVNASTAGAVEGKATIGPLNGTAELTVLRFDRLSRKVVDYQIASVATDGTARVSSRIPYPQVEADPEENILAPGLVDPDRTEPPESIQVPHATPANTTLSKLDAQD